MLRWLRLILLCFLSAGFAVQAASADSPEVLIGKRLFLETRFAQFFRANSNGDANATLASGDPTVATTATTTGLVDGPFAGQSMSCRACHLVDEHRSTLGNRTYNDFARHSPIPVRDEDDRTVTVRNTPPLVDAFVRRPGGLLLHFDGEYRTGSSLAVDTLTGRNFGWLSSEYAEATAHIAHIIREDDGADALAQEFGGKYSDVFAAASSVPKEFRLPVGYRIRVDRASDAQVVKGVGRLIEAYLRSLKFSRDERGRYSGSPYDVFLRKNLLPLAPRPGESDKAYGKRLLGVVNRLKQPKWVTNEDRTFSIHPNQTFSFGASELAGLKIFLSGTGTKPVDQVALVTGGLGNCIECHAPPSFTDFRFHNTGSTQEEYDSNHGVGAFVEIAIPTFDERNADPDAYLPPSSTHPNATGKFASIPHVDYPGAADLGLWNVFANPDHPQAQGAILRSLTEGKPASKRDLLPLTVGLFKTSVLRDLADSAPYLHNGSKNSIEEVLEFYWIMGDTARAGDLRNSPPEYAGMAFFPPDFPPVAAFLRSLNEDYEP